jgi:inosose dehydratase
MSKITRRQYIQWTAAALVADVLPAGRWAFAERTAERKGCTLSTGTYGMKGVKLEEAIQLLAEIGYDGIEIATQPGFDGEPAKWSPDRRKEVRRLLDKTRLKLTALMEHLPPASDDRQHRADVERLGRVMDLARELAPDAPPLVQTVLGGGTWDEKKNFFRDRLADWLAAARERKVVLAIKPHRGGALSRPSEAVWLIEQLDKSPWLRLVYDYSHYAFRDMPLEETVRTALPYTAQIAVKDAVQREGRVQFLLPGESGTFDYAKLLKLFYDGGYRGDICCEVSSMVSGKPDYDPKAAAKTCYENMARAFEKAKVPRR